MYDALLHDIIDVPHDFNQGGVNEITLFFQSY